MYPPNETKRSFYCMFGALNSSSDRSFKYLLVYESPQTPNYNNNHMNIIGVYWFYTIYLTSTAVNNYYFEWWFKWEL